MEQIIQAIGVNNIITFAYTLLWVIVIGLPIIIFIFRKYDIPLRIAGLTLSPKRSKTRKQSDDIAYSYSKRTHRNCPLFSHLVLILEEAQTHAKSICSITLQEKLNSQMKGVEQQLKFMANAVKDTYKRCVEEYYKNNPDDQGRSSIGTRLLVFNLVLTLVIVELKTKFKDLLMSDTLLEFSNPEWDDFKSDYFKEIIITVGEIVEKIYPTPIFENFGCDFDAVIKNKDLLKSLQSYTFQTLDQARIEEAYYKAKEMELKENFLMTMNKIIDCQIDVDFSVEGLKKKE